MKTSPPDDATPDATNAADKQGIQVIGRAASILRALQGQPDGMSLGELSKAVTLPRSTVQRIVDALDTEGLVLSSSATSGVRLGPALLSLAAATRFHVAEAARESLKALVKEAGETVDLSLADQEKMVFIEQVAATHRLSVASAVGVSFPMHCCANGKAVLALMNEAEFARVKKRLRLTSMTAQTITDWDVLEAEIAEVRKSGVGYDHEETAEGICAVATAFRSPSGEFVSISVVAPTARFKGSEARLISALRTHTAALRERLQR
ncbi:MAG: IclR family transcriptional regulator [Pseudomonadota bacterium]